MAEVNGFIIYRINMKKDEQQVPSHAEYTRRLHMELKGITAASLSSNMSAEELVSGPFRSSEHQLQNQESLYRPKRRQHLCNAPPRAKVYETIHYCQRCTDFHGGNVPICNCVRRKETGNKSTCGQIWHDTWVNGTAISASLKKHIWIRKSQRDKYEGEEE